MVAVDALKVCILQYANLFMQNASGAPTATGELCKTVENRKFGGAYMDKFFHIASLDSDISFPAGGILHCVLIFVYREELVLVFGSDRNGNA